jgi:hypothetical protein
VSVVEALLGTFSAYQISASPLPVEPVDVALVQVAPVLVTELTTEPPLLCSGWRWCG